MVYALAGMLLLSIANISLKVFVGGFEFPAQLNPVWLAVVVVCFSIAGYALYNIFGFTGGALQLALIVILFSFLGFVCVFLALARGKVAVVTAILSLGTVVVALLSIYFLGDEFSVKEGLAMIFAVIALLVLVI